ncbi:MAG: hypothetical protein ACP5HP_03300, partial [Thermogladius sp.]
HRSACYNAYVSVEALASLAASAIAVFNSAYNVGTRHPFQTVYVVRVSWFIGRPWYFKPCD